MAEESSAYLEEIAKTGPWGEGLRQNPIALEAIRLYFVERMCPVEIHEKLDWNSWVTLALVEEFIVCGMEIDDNIAEVTLDCIKWELDDLEGWIDPAARREALERLQSVLLNIEKPEVLRTVPPAIPMISTHDGH